MFLLIGSTLNNIISICICYNFILGQIYCFEDLVRNTSFEADLQMKCLKNKAIPQILVPIWSNISTYFIMSEYIVLSAHILNENYY